MKSWNEQDGRLRQTFAIAETGHEVRIPGGALDSVIRLATAEAILHDLREDEKFTRVMRGIDPLIVKYLRMSEKILFKAEELILGGITAGQLKSILNQCQHVNVTLSAVPVAMCDNMEHDDLRAIVKAATSSDNCCSCGEPWTRCPGWSSGAEWWWPGCARMGRCGEVRWMNKRARYLRLQRKKAFRKSRWRKRDERVFWGLIRMAQRITGKTLEELANLKPVSVSDEMTKLRVGLYKMGVKWLDHSERNKDMPEYDIERTWFEIKGNKWSVIHGHGSYGGWFLDGPDAGLLEVMTSVVNGGDPVGWLTAEQVLEEVRKWL